MNKANMKRKLLERLKFFDTIETIDLEQFFNKKTDAFGNIEVSSFVELVNQSRPSPEQIENFYNDKVFTYDEMISIKNNLVGTIGYEAWDEGVKFYIRWTILRTESEHEYMLRMKMIEEVKEAKKLQKRQREEQQYVEYLKLRKKFEK